MTEQRLLATRTDRPLRQLATKVPLVTATFWVIKILSTTVGETFADFLNVNVGLGSAVTDGFVFAALGAALWLQLSRPRYTPWTYWLCVVLVSISGTQITDYLTDTLGVSLYVSTGVFAVILAVVFAVWYREEMTLSIASINTRRRESFYWGAILTTFALGTAAGDLATEALGLGFRNGSLIFGAGFLLTFLAWRARAWQVLAFWVAYILTRPLGASIGDLLTQDRAFGGLGLGANRTSLLFFAVIIVLVAREQLVNTRSGIPQVSTAAASPLDSPGGWNLDRGAMTGSSGDEDAAGKGAPTLGTRADLLWAAAGVVAVVAVSITLMGTSTPAPAAAVAAADPSASAPAGPAKPGTSAAARRSAVAPVKPVTPLGDLSSFSTIVDGVAAKVTQHDLGAAKTRVKDLEVAWDDAEAGLKPRAASDWHAIDDAIDGVLTSLRADQPNQQDCSAAVTALQKLLHHDDGQG